MDSKSNLKELFSSKDGIMGHNGLVLIDSHIKDLPGLLSSEDSGAKSASKLDRAYLSFNGVRVDGNEHDDKKSENLLKSVLPALVPTLSFNDKMHTTANSGLQSQRTSTTIIKLSITKKSVEEETNELCEYPLIIVFLIKIIISDSEMTFVIPGASATKYLYRPRAGLLMPCSPDGIPTPGTWSEIKPSTFKLRGETYFKYAQYKSIRHMHSALLPLSDCSFAETRRRVLHRMSLLTLQSA